MSIAKQIIVRYRAEGHVRFAVPSEVCQPLAAQHLEMKLKQVEGIYRVDLHRGQGKLSIRYIEGVTHFKLVARALFDALDDLNNMETQPTCCASSIANQEEQSGKGWLEAKYQEVKETITALGIVTRTVKPLALTPEKEKFVIEFLTDILVLYLIKQHWHLIMGHWIRSPWQYRSEWMATIYMIFLLVRSKKPKK